MVAVVYISVLQLVCSIHYDLEPYSISPPEQTQLFRKIIQVDRFGAF